MLNVNLGGVIRNRDKNDGTLDLNTSLPKLSDLVSKVVDANIVTNEAIESTVIALLGANDDGVAVATSSVLDNDDYEFELPIASVHEVNGSLKNSLYGYARALIEINACNEFRDNLVMVVPKLEVTKKKLGGNNGNKNSTHVSLKSKFAYRPKTMQLAKGPSVSPNATIHADTNVASTSGCNKGITSTKPLVARINKLEIQMLDGKLVLFDDSNEDGKDYGKSILLDLQESDEDAEAENEDTGNSMFDLVDDTKKKVGAPPRKLGFGRGVEEAENGNVPKEHGVM
ncbi:hypothetical protein Tco_1129177, partial [Tanacetum coccineum]